MRLFRCPHRIFITSLRWPRDTVEMQGIELVAIFSLLSSLFSLFSAPSSLLSSALDSRNRIPAFLQGIMRPRGVLHCKNEAIRGGPGANKPCCQSIWESLAAVIITGRALARPRSLLLPHLSSERVSERSSEWLSWWAIRRTHSRMAAAAAGADSGCKIK